VAFVVCANAGVSDAVGAERKASAPTAKARTPNPTDVQIFSWFAHLVSLYNNNCGSTVEQFLFYPVCRLAIILS